MVIKPNPDFWATDLGRFILAAENDPEKLRELREFLAPEKKEDDPNFPPLRTIEETLTGVPRPRRLAALLRSQQPIPPLDRTYLADLIERKIKKKRGPKRDGRAYMVGYMARFLHEALAAYGEPDPHHRAIEIVALLSDVPEDTVEKWVRLWRSALPPVWGGDVGNTPESRQPSRMPTNHQKKIRAAKL